MHFLRSTPAGYLANSLDSLVRDAGRFFVLARGGESREMRLDQTRNVPEAGSLIVMHDHRFLQSPGDARPLQSIRGHTTQRRFWPLFAAASQVDVVENAHRAERVSRPGESARLPDSASSLLIPATAQCLYP